MDENETRELIRKEIENMLAICFGSEQLMKYHAFYNHGDEIKKVLKRKEG